MVHLETKLELPKRIEPSPRMVRGVRLPARVHWRHTSPLRLLFIRHVFRTIFYRSDINGIAPLIYDTAEVIGRSVIGIASGGGLFGDRAGLIGSFIATWNTRNAIRIIK